MYISWKWSNTSNGSWFFPLGFIDELSKHIGGDWKKLARKLGLSKTDIDAVYYDNLSSLEEQIFQFFDKWKQKTGMNATEKLLIDGLKAAKLNETLQKLQKAGFLPKGKMLPHL